MCEESNNDEFEQAIQSFGIKNEEDLMVILKIIFISIDKLITFVIYNILAKNQQIER